ncbi:iron-containing alcohol dehydrogenase [Oscillospiraceae bacterium MB08-C2-2]|nr:iron-containing alcohol dehydrogenase [Oscillospiraceae bacterium MB08-C2-2]
MNNYQLKMPPVVFAGTGALVHIGSIVAENKAQRVAVFTDKGIAGAGILDLALAPLRASGIGYKVFDDLAPEPTYQQAQALIDQSRAYQADFIMAVGGGSVMDTAKLASLMLTDEYTVKDLLDNPAQAKKQCKTLMVPTTAGTGAEATPNAIVAVPEKELKVGIVNPIMIADYVILDAAMIKKLPRKIASATGIDALAHAIECFTSNKATPFSNMFALQALEIIFRNIEAACDEPDNMDAKNAMLLASFYAGVAITASGTTAVHALSYPLGGKYHIAHGVSNAILLAPVMRFNQPVCKELFAAAYDRCFQNHALSTEEKSDFLITRMEEIIKHLEIPTSLKEFGVPSEDLETLVEAGMQVTRLLQNNMRTVTADDARKIYLQIIG